jgi:uronate dehydrogenase
VLHQIKQYLPKISKKKIVLLTGAAGTIGTSLRKYLGDQYHFRCLDIKAVSESYDVRIVDITNFKSVLKAMRSVDAVIHLAANPDPRQSWQDVYASGINGTYNVFEAARQAGVKKIIYASSGHVLGEKELKEENYVTQEGCVSPEMPINPTSLYGVGKACGEALARFFAAEYDMQIICLRIGWFRESLMPEASNRSQLLKAWCSPRDLAQLIQLSLEKTGLGFQIFYAISGNSRRIWDISSAQSLLGYEPQDNAENHLG